MTVLFDVDIEIDCAVPTAPLIDGDHIVVAGGEVALLALCHRETGTVEKALFNDEPDVDVSAPVCVALGDDAHGYAFASIDRPRLHLNITVVDANLRVLRTRDISADDPDTPELLIEGRITHFSVHVDGSGTAFFVVAVRDDTPASLRLGVPPTAVRCVWAEDLAPRWSSSRDVAVGTDRDVMVAERGNTLLAINAMDGEERWGDVSYGADGMLSAVGVGDGVVVIAHHEGDDEYAISTLELRDIVTGVVVRRVDFDNTLRALAVHPRGALLTYAQRGARHILLHTDADTKEHAIDHPAHIVAEDVALVGPDLLLWPVTQPLPTVVPLYLSARARATIEGELVVIRDGRRLIALEK